MWAKTMFCFLIVAAVACLVGCPPPHPPNYPTKPIELKYYATDRGQSASALVATAAIPRITSLTFTTPQIWAPMDSCIRFLRGATGPLDRQPRWISFSGIWLHGALSSLLPKTSSPVRVKPFSTPPNSWCTPTVIQPALSFTNSRSVRLEPLVIPKEPVAQVKPLLSRLA